MNGITDFFNRLVRGMLRLLLFAALTVFLLSLLAATLVVMLAVTIWSIATGRKPEPAKIFGQFRQTSARYTRGAWSGARGPGTGGGAKPDDIVDIPAHDVRDVTGADGAKRPGHPGTDPMARMRHQASR